MLINLPVPFYNRKNKYYLEYDFDFEIIDKDQAPLVLSFKSDYCSEIFNDNYINGNSKNKKLSLLFSQRIQSGVDFKRNIEVRYFKDKFYYKCYTLNLKMNMILSDFNIDYIPINSNMIHNFFKNSYSILYKKVFSNILISEIENFSNREFLYKEISNLKLSSFFMFELFYQHYIDNNMDENRHIIDIKDKEFFNFEKFKKIDIKKVYDIFNINKLLNIFQYSIKSNFIIIDNELWCSGGEPIVKSLISKNIKNVVSVSDFDESVFLISNKKMIFFDFEIKKIVDYQVFLYDNKHTYEISTLNDYSEDHFDFIDKKYFSSNKHYIILKIFRDLFHRNISENKKVNKDNIIDDKIYYQIFNSLIKKDSEECLNIFRKHSLEFEKFPYGFIQKNVNSEKVNVTNLRTLIKYLEKLT